VLEVETFFHLALDFDSFCGKLFAKIVASVAAFLVLKGDWFGDGIRFEYFVWQVVWIAGNHQSINSEES
jgi:hypothetical protein